ncbi:MAG TPA: hypothetical protein VF384_03065 [Planctomycetota bacterium]
MKKNEPPIPLRSVVCLPRWLMLGGVTLSVACMLAGVVLAVHGLATASGGALGGRLGGAFGCLIGGAGALVGTLADWRRRAPAPLLFAQLQRDKPLPIYRMFWPSLIAAIVGLVLYCIWGNWFVSYPIVLIGGIFAFIAGCQETIRRHSTREARAVFTLYADGMLDGDDAAAIDDARKKDAKFDAAVQEFRRVAAALRRIDGAGPAG